MHLLLAQKGSIADGEEAVDLGQTPGDILFLSAADTELAAIAAAVSSRAEGPSFRLASLMSLKHPMSVDTYVERTARHAKLIVVRALGGASYFHYALEALHACARRSGAAVAVLPGDDKPDGGLAEFSTLSSEDLGALWAYLIEGGEANARAFVDYACALIAHGEKPAPAAPLLKAGIWWPGRGAVGVGEWKHASTSAPHPPAGTFSPSNGEKGSAAAAVSPYAPRGGGGGRRGGGGGNPPAPLCPGPRAPSPPPRGLRGTPPPQPIPSPRSTGRRCRQA
ncbi:MAG: hypothetical protein K0M49_15165, partial [Arenimonas sp.]|nr:hypothetical protein [Arenimonas sp.]